MKKLESFRDLIVWQLASDFSKNIALLVKSFPRDEQYKLSDDFLRAARSIAANISEGWGRFFPKEKISFYNIARGSAEECKNHIIEAYNCSYIDSARSEQLQKKAHIISVKLTNLITATRKRIKTPAKRIKSSGMK